MLFKGGGALETLAAVDTFAFDKTGTWTNGRAAVPGLSPWMAMIAVSCLS